MRHGAVVSHADEECVFGNAQLFEFVHDPADKGIDVSLQAVLQYTSRCREFLGVWDETRQVRPVGDVKRLAGLGVSLDELQRAPLGLGVDLHIVLVAVVAPLARLAAFCALGHLHPALGDECIVEFVGIGRQHVLVQAHGGVRPFGDSGIE